MLRRVTTERVKSELPTYHTPYAQTTRGIRVTVYPDHIIEESEPEAGLFAFAYTVTIENLGSETVQLLERHWVIHSGGNHLAEVVGPGVVGEEPVIEAGEVFEYTSSAVIQDADGTMHGSYTFRSDNGDFFDVPIPRFDLVYPLVIH